MKIIITVVILIIIFLIFIIFESIRELKLFTIKRYNIINDKLPKQFNGYKIILMADLHNTFYNKDNIIKTVIEEKPNGVVIAGDMVTYKDNQRHNNIKSIELIKEIAMYSDVYYAPGNHEMGYMTKKEAQWYEYEQMLLENDNIYFLDNKTVELSRNEATIKLAGIYLKGEYYKRFIKKELTNNTIDSLLGNCDNNNFNILIAHHPDYFSDYSNWGADVVLSGHNHGGLMRLPIFGGVISPRLRIFPKYDYGLFKAKNSTLVLTSGLGAHSLKIRVNNLPEIVLINLYNK